MGRAILAVLVGYIVMAVAVLSAFTLVLFMPDFAYQRDSLDVTTGWLVYAIGVSLFAALTGGLVCALIARTYRPVIALAVIVLGLGLLEGGRNQMRDRPTKTPEEIAAMSVSDRAQISVQPPLYAFLLPFVGAVGVLLGGRLTAARR